MMSDGSDFPDDSINLFDYGLGMKEIIPINSSYIRFQNLKLTDKKFHQMAVKSETIIFHEK